ncbi:MAG: hypothetical protein RIE22_09330 [Alphaproteobacteria bacterium]
MSWLSGLKRYLSVIVIGNLIWEFAHMPLYTLWLTGTRSEIVFAAIHCTGGDILIALSALTVALIFFGTHQWPERSFQRVALSTVIFGIGHTLFSEWLNIEIRQSWAYRDLMPMVPGTGVGLSPLVQWIAVPLLAFWWIGPAKVPDGSKGTETE